MSASESLASSVLTAMQLKTAIDEIPKRVPKLGYVVKVPWALLSLEDTILIEDSEGRSEVSTARSDDSEEAEAECRAPLLKDRHQEITHKLYQQMYPHLIASSRSSADTADIRAVLAADYDSYYRDLETAMKHFHLWVSLPEQASCEYDGSTNEVPEELIKKWWEHCHVSEYGNVPTETNECDPSVSVAREWKGEEIRVNRLVTDVFEVMWGKMMQPADVRVTLHKLNVYGPGGKFIAHKDTPETDLVGTILIGLGDSTDKAAGFKVEGRKKVWRAKKAEHIMFYSDVIHEVLPISSGYSATLAFKVFGRNKGCYHCDKTKDKIHKYLSHLSEISIQVPISFEHETSRLRLQWFPTMKPEYSYTVLGYQYRAEGRDPGINPKVDSLTETQLAELEAKRDLFKKREAEAIEQWRLSYDKLEFNYRQSQAELLSTIDSVGISDTFRVIQQKLRAHMTKHLSSQLPPFGFLLNDEYSHETQELLPADQELYDILNGISELRIVVMPVLTSYKANRDYLWDWDRRHVTHEESATVYPVTDAHVRNVLQNLIPSMATACNISEAEAAQMTNVPILSLNLRKGFTWFREYHAHHEGERQLESGIWLHRAFIVVKRTGEELNK